MVLIRKPSTQAALSPQCKTSPGTQQLDSEGDELAAESLDDPGLHVWTLEEAAKETFSHSELQTPQEFQHEEEEEEEHNSEILLHTLLMVPDGKNFSCASTKAPNMYLNCKLFWCDEMARSVVSWGQTNPTFAFVQVRFCPVASNFHTTTFVLIFLTLTSALR